MSASMMNSCDSHNQRAGSPSQAYRCLRAYVTDEMGFSMVGLNRASAYLAVHKRRNALSLSTACDNNMQDSRSHGIDVSHFASKFSEIHIPPGDLSFSIYVECFRMLVCLQRCCFCVCLSHPMCCDVRILPQQQRPQ